MPVSCEGTGIGVSVVRMFWHGRRYGAARMLINDEDPDNMQRHGSVKPVCCCFLCILIDPSLLFNMTAAPRATVRPALCYLAVWCTPMRQPRRVFLFSCFLDTSTMLFTCTDVLLCLHDKPACCFSSTCLCERKCVYVLKVTLNRNMWGRIVLFAW